jgi:hypothetical protein
MSRARARARSDAGPGPIRVGTLPLPLTRGPAVPLCPRYLLLPPAPPAQGARNLRAHHSRTRAIQMCAPFVRARFVRARRQCRRPTPRTRARVRALLPGPCRRSARHAFAKYVELSTVAT